MNNNAPSLDRYQPGFSPPDAMIFFDGMHHKVGSNKRVFVWRDSEWRLSQKSIDLVLKNIRRSEKGKALIESSRRDVINDA